MTKYRSYFRGVIDAMSGYTPGEQMALERVIKLNTNENPYSPSPMLRELLDGYNLSALARYPDPFCVELREVIAKLHGVSLGNIIPGNGSDDILTIAIRSFVGEGEAIACIDPTYSLYSVLADIQGASSISIPLEADFSLPEQLAEKAAGAKMFVIPNPNAPTGNTFDRNKLEELCATFDGIVLIDEAYADFAESNCVDFASRFANVIISRTLSKSYSLAGIRLGYALADEKLIDGMMKVKDSYNVNYLTQALGKVALLDQLHLKKNVATIRETRQNLSQQLTGIGFTVVPSQANFLFVTPPTRDAKGYFEKLKMENIIVRYFPGDRTGEYVRITIGTPSEMKQLLAVTRKIYS